MQLPKTGCRPESACAGRAAEEVGRPQRESTVGQAFESGSDPVILTACGQPPGRIACLAWGSLVWSPRGLPVAAPWFTDGPMLPVEFTRHSSRERVTLVVVSGVRLVQTLWAWMPVSGLEDARRVLAEREDVVSRMERDIGWWSAEGPVMSDMVVGGVVGAWAAERSVESVVWTALAPKWQRTEGRVPTAGEVLAFLQQRPAGSDAEEYIKRAPCQIRTAYREAIEHELGWIPIEERGDEGR